MDVLFVCTGNTCRSPMAEEILRRRSEDQHLRLSIGSAGLRAGSAISPQAARALQRRGLHIEKRTPVQLTEEMVQEASLVLCMTEEQRSVIATAMPGDAAKVHAWAAFVDESQVASATEVAPGPGPARYDVFDPLGGEDAAYEQTASVIESLAVLTLKVPSSDC